MGQTAEQARDQLDGENLRLREQAGEMAEEIERLRARVTALEAVATEAPRLTYGKPEWVREGDHEFLLVRVSAAAHAAMLAALAALNEGVAR